MKDNFKEYIEQNKNDFDELKADKMKLWDAIENRLPQVEPKVIPLWKKSGFRVAASVLFLIGITLSFYLFNQNTTEVSIEYVKLNEIDAHYKELVNYQVELINNSSKLTKEERIDFLSFLDDLDNEYKELKIELKENVNNEKVLEAIIDNYRKKIKLMENLLQRQNLPNSNNNENEYVL